MNAIEFGTIDYEFYQLSAYESQRPTYWDANVVPMFWVIAGALGDRLIIMITKRIPGVGPWFARGLQPVT
jgi:hypothetical protein